ncbi:MAG: aminotransferase class III-fold pyridoxal phosphate-dependent enzyme [Proteobacteria bacterium]|jgi:glutamate-1-semialdehyde 2,1-aminomutase|nr:aminotransferase class III-fold pyridoxal phosphate-dependent enzyme [Pseudomonadota bacterium]
MKELSPAERAAIPVLCAGNEHMAAVIEQVIARQKGSVAAHRRSLNSLSGTPSMLSYEAPLLPLCVKSAKGGRITDVDGNEYIDCHLAYTATILGHNPPQVLDAVKRGLDAGIDAGHLFEEQVDLAELVQSMVPDVERVAFFHTGGEAVSAATRLCRATKRKTRIAKFEGCYHGSNEVGLHNTWMALSGMLQAGSLDNIMTMAATAGAVTREEEYLILPYNVDVALELLRQHAHELACVVMDPAPPFMSIWLDDAKRFVTDVGAICDEMDVPLIFDEVVCGFRLAEGGARQWSGHKPQMSCFGKVVSGLGVPLSMVAGDAKYVDRISTGGLFRDAMMGKAWVASTGSGNFVSVLASLAQMRYLKEHHSSLMARIDSNASYLRERLSHFAAKSGLPVSLQGNSRLQMQLSIGKKEPESHTYRDMMASSSQEAFRTLMAMVFYLRLNNIYTKIIPTMNLSAAHTDEDMSMLADGIERAVLQMDKDGMLLW